jgi:plasmid stabilization system protein ParE
MAKRKWDIELTKRLKDNLDQILLYLSQKISEKYSQNFLKEFYDKLHDIQRFPKMYPKFSNLNKPNIRHFVFNNYRIVYEIITENKIIRILTIFHAKQQSKI